MDETPHVLLAGAGAEALARRVGLEPAGPEWFGERAAEHAPGDAQPSPSPRDPADAQGGGTVGAVVLDDAGRLAAATSTGGVRGQLPGRVGDTPLPGAGTFADDRVAVSCTGNGEAIMRTVAAHEVASLVRHAGLPLTEAGRRAADALRPLGGGGLIAVAADGSIAASFTTEAMYRASATGDEPVATAVFAEG
jgi:beta-aspartyl-peptidase (threonine type)